MHHEHLEGDAGHEHPLLGAAWTVPEDMTYTHSGEAVPGVEPGSDTDGHPQAEATDWQYQGTQDGLCGPTSIAMVVNEFSPSAHVSGAEVAQWASTHGEMIPDGQPVSAGNYGYLMSVQQISAVLAHYGVQNQVVQGGSEAQLEGWLASGHQVILAVDGERIWHDVPASQDPGQADHAVVLTGIDPKTGWAYLNDPGSPDGRMEAVPLSELMSAWSTSGDAAVVTDGTAGDHPAEVAPPHPHPHAVVTDHPSHHGGAVILPVLLRHELLELVSDAGRL